MEATDSSSSVQLTTRSPGFRRQKCEGSSARKGIVSTGHIFISHYQTVG
jgi:hypothetical protein